jgi:hypothetical protein
LLEIVETLRAKGVYFRSINDPIDTSSAQGMLMTQMLGAFAEFERALIRERTRAGIKAAVARGAKPGNPKMRMRDPAAIAEIIFSHNQRHLNELIDERHRWLPTVERLRPHLPWALVLRQVRAITPPVRSFSERTLAKACRNLVRAGYADPSILEAAPRLPLDTRVARLVADRLNTHPDSTLRENRVLAVARLAGANSARGNIVVTRGRQARHCAGAGPKAAGAQCAFVIAAH